MAKIILPISGMHCRSCEILIAEKLEQIPGVKNVKVSHTKKQATIYSSNDIDQRVLSNAIKEAGYAVGTDEKPMVSQEFTDYCDLAIAAILLIIIYIVFRSLGLSSLTIGSSSSTPSSLLVVFTVGITAGLSTCMAMVGGLIFGASARYAEQHPDATTLQKFRPHLFFNLGRVIGYTVFGGIIGAIGSALRLSGTSLGVLTILVAIVMVILGIQLLDIFPRFSNGLTLPTWIAKLFGIKARKEREYSHANSMVLGGLTFFLPCGFTQAMQLYAITTGHFWTGAAIMGVFALGTAPGLIGVGGLASAIKGAFAKRFFKFAGLLVIALAIFNFSNGLNLTGWHWPSSGSGNGSVEAVIDSPSPTSPVAVSSPTTQTINMDQAVNGYFPNHFTVKSGVPVNWVINSKNSQTCASILVVPELNLEKNLDPGNNEINFTPKKPGKFYFSCAMGMFGGDITVI